MKANAVPAVATKVRPVLRPALLPILGRASERKSYQSSGKPAYEGSKPKFNGGKPNTAKAKRASKRKGGPSADAPAKKYVKIRSSK